MSPSLCVCGVGFDPSQPVRWGPLGHSCHRWGGGLKIDVVLHLAALPGDNSLVSGKAEKERFKWKMRTERTGMESRVWGWLEATEGSRNNTC